MIFGTYDSRDLAAVSVADYTQGAAIEDMRRFAAKYDQNIRDQLGAIAQFDDKAIFNFGVGTAGELQPMGEHSRGVEAVRAAGDWNIGLPIGRFGHRVMYTKEFLLRATLAQLERDTLTAAVSDATTLSRLALRAVLQKTNYTFVDRVDFPGVGLGTLTVRRLFNADSATGQVPDPDGNPQNIGALQHYVGSNSTTWANGFFQTLQAKLENVGLGEDTVFWIARSDVANVSALSGFVDTGDPNVILDPAAPVAIIRSARAIGRMKRANGNGEVQVMPGMPAGYIFAYDRSDTPPVQFRIPAEAQLQGFFLTANDTAAEYDNEPLRNKHWERIVGAGVKNRRNGACMQVVASTTYTDPTTI